MVSKCPFCNNIKQEFFLFENKYFFSILNTRSGNPGDCMVIAKPDVKEFDIHNCDLRVILNSAVICQALNECIISTQNILEKNVKLRREKYQDECMNTIDDEFKKNAENVLKSKNIDKRIVAGCWEYREYAFKRRTLAHYHLHLSPKYGEYKR